VLRLVTVLIEPYSGSRGVLSCPLHTTQALTPRTTHPPPPRPHRQLSYCPLQARPCGRPVPRLTCASKSRSRRRRPPSTSAPAPASVVMSGTTDHIRSTIEQDKVKHPHCSYSTLRSHFSSFLNGSSKAETLTKIIRNCEVRRRSERLCVTCMSLYRRLKPLSAHLCMPAYSSFGSLHGSIPTHYPPHPFPFPNAGRGTRRDFHAQERERRQHRSSW